MRTATKILRPFSKRFSIVRGFTGKSLLISRVKSGSRENKTEQCKATDQSKQLQSRISLKRTWKRNLG